MGPVLQLLVAMPIFLFTLLVGGMIYLTAYFGRPKKRRHGVPREGMLDVFIAVVSLWAAFFLFFFSEPEIANVGWFLAGVDVVLIAIRLLIKISHH